MGGYPRPFVSAHTCLCPSEPVKKKISFGAKFYLHRLGFTLGNRISLYNPGWPLIDNSWALASPVQELQHAPPHPTQVDCGNSPYTFPKTESIQSQTQNLKHIFMQTTANQVPSIPRGQQVIEGNSSTTWGVVYPFPSHSYYFCTERQQHPGTTAFLLCLILFYKWRRQC